jgi:hypothetical protein
VGATVEYDRATGNNQSFPAQEVVLAQFPGMIAVVQSMVTAATATVTIESTNDQPWAVEVGYHQLDRRLLTVRTVRSAQGVSSYGLPVEDLASAVVNFQLNADGGTAPVLSGSATEPWIDRQRDSITATRGQVAAIPITAATLTVDDTAVTGTRVDVDGCAAVEIRWHLQTVFCTGRPETFDYLSLTMVSAAHLATDPP